MPHGGQRLNVSTYWDLKLVRELDQTRNQFPSRSHTANRIQFGFMLIANTKTDLKSDQT